MLPHHACVVALPADGIVHHSSTARQVRLPTQRLVRNHEVHAASSSVSHLLQRCGYSSGLAPHGAVRLATEGTHANLGLLLAAPPALAWHLLAGLLDGHCERCVSCQVGVECACTCRAACCCGCGCCCGWGWGWGAEGADWLDGNRGQDAAGHTGGDAGWGNRLDRSVGLTVALCRCEQR